MRLKRDTALRKYWGRSGLKAGSSEFRGLRIACLVRNQSETGATLEVVSANELPAQFTLLVAADRTRHRCIIIWRTGKMIGVKFL
jgi:hypothetical protein